MITIEKALSIIQDHGGTIRTTEAIQAGIAPKTFYAMRDQGLLIQLSRGTLSAGRHASARQPGPDHRLQTTPQSCDLPGLRPGLFRSD